MIVSFCGHASFCQSEECEQKILSFLEKNIGNQAAEMYLGGYGGFDSFAYSCCKKYKESHPNISLVFVTPYLSVEYQRNHLNELQEKYDSILYPEIEEKPLKLAIYYRNRYMIERASYVIAYVDHSWGGAFQAYKYAIKLGKLIFNLGNIN